MIQVDETDPIGEVEPSFPTRDVVIRRGVDVKDFFDLQAELGRGKFGTVYRCCEKQSGLQLAAKFVGTPRREDRRNVEREIEIMRCLQHARLIQLYDAFDNGQMMCVILELIEGGELFERVIDDDFVLTEKSCTVFMRQICEGIEFIHQNNILHLDMKPENILCLTRTGNRIKIIDFGLARKYDPEKKLQVLFGTPEFVAPEIVNFDQIGFGTDMWSIGVICYVLLSGLSPFMGETDIETMANVTVAKYDFDDEVFNEISPDAKDFIQKLMIKDKDQRMSASQCLAHNWLRRKPPAAPPKIITPIEELDTSKDNLRQFVERWSENPNNPYLFDKSCHVISPYSLSLPNCNLIETAMSQHSLRGYSPSPCGSLSSSPESVIEHDIIAKSPDDSNFLHYTFEQVPVNRPKNHVDRFQTFERRNSDSSCVVRHNGDVAGCVNLADEIRKLSDRLFQMASLHNDSTPSLTQESNSNSNSINSSLNSRIQTFPKSFPFNNVVSNGLVKNNPFQQGTFIKNSDSSFFEDLTGNKRTKIKMSNLNRDVPIGSVAPSNAIWSPPSTSSSCSSRNSSDTLPSCHSLSSASSLSNAFSSRSSPDRDNPPPMGATDTKDLLLHLLHKWDDKQTNNTGPVDRSRKSFSMEWSEEESLGQRSMNSLATFFQSSRSSVDKKRSTIVPPN